jgi:hypothetical protein
MEEPQYANVDLELASRRSLAPLVEAWEELATKMRDDWRGGVHFVSFEVSVRRVRNPGPNATIRAFVRLVEALPPRLRALWDGAHRRAFDVGVEMGSGPFVPVVDLSRDTIRRVAEVGGSIVSTVYPPLRSQGSNEPRNLLRYHRIE